MPLPSLFLHSGRRCGARFRHGGEGRCRRWALVGKGRCKLHGGASTGPVNKPGFSPQARAARLKVKKYVKLAGRRKWEPIEISRMRVRVKSEIAKLQNPADLFERLRLKALLKAEEILDLPTDLETVGGDPLMQHRRLVLQGSLTQSVLSDAIRIDESAMRQAQTEDALELLRQRVAIAEKKLPPEKK